MSEPARLENGYLRLANELQDAFCRYPFKSAEERRVLDAVIRLTYGYSRSEAAIGLGRFVKLTGLPQRTIERCLARLVEAGVLFRKGRTGDAGSKKASVWRLNKRPRDWVWPPGPGMDDPVRTAPRSSTYSKDREPAAGDTSTTVAAVAEPPPGYEPGADKVELDELTKQLMAEGFSGRGLAQEHAKRFKRWKAEQAQRTDTADGTSRERTDTAVGGSGERTDSGDGTSPSRARARDVPTAASDQRTDSRVGGLKDTLKDRSPLPLTSPPGYPAFDPGAAPPDGAAAPAGGPGQTTSSDDEPGADKPPERHQPPTPPPRRESGPTHVGALLRSTIGDLKP